MKWFGHRPTVEVPPLEIPTDLDSGTHARREAERALTAELANDRGVSFLRAAMRDIVQENHIREHIYQAHGG